MYLILYIPPGMTFTFHAKRIHIVHINWKTAVS